MNDPMVILGFALLCVIGGFVAGVALAAYRQTKVEQEREWRLRRMARDARP